MKTFLFNVALTLIAVFLMVSCGRPDHSDPRSVADTAVKYYADSDLESMKDLMNPADKEKRKEFEELIALLTSLSETGTAKASEPDRPKLEDYAFKSITGEYGLPITPETTEIEVKYKVKGRTFIVPLEKVNGKWYLSGIPH